MSGSLTSVINSAASGLAAATAGIAVLSNNVSNAGVTGYTDKSLDLSSFLVGSQTMGVTTGAVTRSVDAAVQASVFAAGAQVAGLTVTNTALTAVNATQGTPGDGNSLADAVTALQDSFTTLLADPSEAANQSAVVSAATTLASTINTTANEVTTQRNAAQSQIVSTVATVNTALATVQQTTQQIMAATASGTSTAALEDQRDTALSTLSSALNVTYNKQANGNISLTGPNGLSIPLDSRLSTSAATLTAGSAYSATGGTIPAIDLVSSNPAIPPVDITSQLTGGSLGALVTLRDTTLPTYTAQLDQFSENLATQFSAQGLTLFTNASGTVPASTGTSSQSGYVGFSTAIQVNPAVVATPSLVRDGTQDVTGSSTGASSFTTNPSTGPASFTTLISRVLNYTFGTDVASGVANTASPTTGLGPLGNLSSTISGSLSLSGTAQAIVAGQSTDTANATAALATATSYQTAVTSQFSDGSGVNVDQQMGLMIQLQNSYQANATVIQTAQAMFSALVNAVTTAG